MFAGFIQVSEPAADLPAKTKRSCAASLADFLRCLTEMEKASPSVAGHEKAASATIEPEVQEARVNKTQKQKWLEPKWLRRVMT